MKATDQEILHAIWKATIKMTANRTLTHYTCKRYGMPSGGFDSEQFVTRLFTPEKRHLGIKLGDCQLLKRLRKLEGIDWESEGRYKISSPQRSAIFLRALELFESYGFTEAPTPLTDIKIKSIKDSVESILLDEFLYLFPVKEGEA
jgi:hypothetical protein